MVMNYSLQGHIYNQPGLSQTFLEYDYLSPCRHLKLCRHSTKHILTLLVSTQPINNLASSARPTTSPSTLLHNSYLASSASVSVLFVNQCTPLLPSTLSRSIQLLFFFINLRKKKGARVTRFDLTTSLFSRNCDNHPGHLAGCEYLLPFSLFSSFLCSWKATKMDNVIFFSFFFIF